MCVVHSDRLARSPQRALAREDPRAEPDSRSLVAWARGEVPRLPLSRVEMK